MADVASECPPSEAPVNAAHLFPPPSLPPLGKGPEREAENIRTAHENREREQGTLGARTWWWRPAC